MKAKVVRLAASGHAMFTDGRGADAIEEVVSFLR